MKQQLLTAAPGVQYEGEGDDVAVDVLQPNSSSKIRLQLFCSYSWRPYRYNVAAMCTDHWTATRPYVEATPGYLVGWFRCQTYSGVCCESGRATG